MNGHPARTDFDYALEAAGALGKLLDQVPAETDRWWGGWRRVVLASVAWIGQRLP